MKAHSFFDEIVTSRNEVFKDFVSDMAVDIRMLGIPTRETAENDDTLQQTAGS